MEKYRQAIQKYYLDITNTDLKETPRKEKFLALLKDLFPNCVDEIQKYTDGSEAGVKINVTGSGIIKNGRIDAFLTSSSSLKGAFRQRGAKRSDSSANTAQVSGAQKHADDHISASLLMASRGSLTIPNPRPPVTWRHRISSSPRRNFSHFPAIRGRTTTSFCS